MLHRRFANATQDLLCRYNHQQFEKRKNKSNNTRIPYSWKSPQQDCAPYIPFLEASNMGKTHYNEERERELTFQNEVLNFLFSEAISFKLFFIAIQGWVGGIVYTTLAYAFTPTNIIHNLAMYKRVNHTCAQQDVFMSHKHIISMTSSMPCIIQPSISTLCKPIMYFIICVISHYPMLWSLIIYLLVLIQTLLTYSTKCMRYLQEGKFLVTSTNRYA